MRSPSPASHGFIGRPVTVTARPPVDLDADGNGVADALTDGVLILRHLFGFTGDALTQGAVDPAGTRTSAPAIADFLDIGRDTMLDVDGNGVADALTDGVVILRFLFGFIGDALTQSAVDPAGTRTDPDAIIAFLNAFLPAAAATQQSTTSALFAGWSSSEPDSNDHDDDTMPLVLRLFDQPASDVW